jgi:hypothetical protein
MLPFSHQYVIKVPDERGEKSSPERRKKSNKNIPYLLKIANQAGVLFFNYSA